MLILCRSTAIKMLPGGYFVVLLFVALSQGGVLKVESTLALDRAWSHFFARAK